MQENEDNDEPEVKDQKEARSQIILRVTRRRKSAYVRAANASKTPAGHGKTLANWYFEHLDRASGYNDSEIEPKK